MRNYPTDKWDRAEAKRLTPERWMLTALKMNPSYCSWGPHEDYMCGDGAGWNARVITENWSKLQFGLDDLNECVNFYFSIVRDNTQCERCGGCCYEPDAQWVSESFYGHSTPFRAQTNGELQSIAVLASFGGGGHDSKVQGYPSEAVLAKYGNDFRDFCEAMRGGDGSWHDQITDDETTALGAAGRLHGLKTTAEVNAANGPRSGRFMNSHDAINRSILIEARLKRFGIPKECIQCEGHGYTFTEDAAHMCLTLWILHPRKGCSRGVEISRIEKSEMPSVIAYLKKAAKRNAARFGKLKAV